MAGNAPKFGLWYDFRQRLPLGDYARFYAEWLDEFEEGEALGSPAGYHPRAGAR